MSVLNTLWLRKSSRTPRPHSQAVRGPTDSVPDTVVASSGPAVESDICGPQALSSVSPYKT